MKQITKFFWGILIFLVIISAVADMVLGEDFGYSLMYVSGLVFENVGEAFRKFV